jgi:MFS family permease
MSFYPYKTTWLAICMVVIASLLYGFDFLIRDLPNLMHGIFMHHFNTQAAGLSMLSASFFYGYALTQIPVGMIGDRYGVRRILILSALLCGTCMLLFSHTSNLSVAYLLRFIMGITAAFAYIGPLMLAAKWLPKKYFSLTTGTVQTIGCLGAIIGLKPLSMAITYYSWQFCLNTIGCGAIILALIFWSTIRESESTSNASLNLRQLIHPIVKHTKLYRIALLGFLIWAPMTIFTELWSIPFFMDHYHLTQNQASSYNSLIWIGIMIGGPLMGFLSTSFISKTTGLLIGFTCILMSCLSIIYWQPVEPIWLSISCLFFGIGAATQCLTFGLINDTCGTSTSGVMIGFQNMAIILSGLMQPVTGYLLELNWTGKIIQKAPWYTLQAYQHMFLLIPGLALIGIGLLIWMRQKQ